MKKIVMIAMMLVGMAQAEYNPHNAVSQERDKYVTTVREG